MMFKTNEGTLDRALRILAGLALLVWFFVDNGTGALHYAKLIGVVPLITGLIGSCPLYTILGLSTCPMKRT
jgi:4-amino-4-deoxy-L-arabinose transferase-like glycosyltransferase